MKMKKGGRFLALLLSGLLMASGLSVAAYADVNGSAATVTIYTTNDIHGVVGGSSTAIGLAQAAGIAASTPNALLVDAGDATQGASFATVNEGADVVRVMNAAGYDVMAAGNHEFDYGADRLLANVQLANFPVLGANVLRNGSPLLADHAIVQAGGHSIGFIGLTTTATATSTNPAKLSGVAFADEVATVKSQISALKDQTDAIVLICHMGDNGAAVGCTSRQLLAALSGDELAEVSAVIDGHSHTLENTVYTAGGISVPVIQAGTQFTNLGVIRLTFDGNGGVTAAGDVMNRDEAMAYPLSGAGQAAAQQVNAVLSSIQEEQNQVLNQVLCTNSTPLWGGYVYYDYAEPRIVETNYGDFVTDAFLASARTFASRNNLKRQVIAVENGGGISATLPMGTVTRKDVLDAFNHGNVVEVLEITPAQLFTALEVGLTMSGQKDTGLIERGRVSGSFLQAAGFTYMYYPGGASGSKVRGIWLDDGTILRRDDNSTKLLVATNNYVSTFTGFSDARKVGELGGEDQIVEEYILKVTENGTKELSVPISANRIQLLEDKTPVSYRVDIPIENVGDGNVQLAGKAVHLRVDGGGLMTCEIDSDHMIHLNLTRGPHTIILKETADGKPVYVNNYSGSGTETKKDGYYHLGFKVKAEELGVREVEYQSIKVKDGTWIKEPEGWRFRYDDFTEPHNMWAYLEWLGAYDWYYFGEDGFLISGWKDYKDDQYYLYPVHDGNFGYMYTGQQEVDGSTYSFNSAVGSQKGALQK